jgi:hypothetical protein
VLAQLSCPKRPLALPLALTALLLLVGLLLPSPSAAAGPLEPQLVAHKYLKAPKGGVVRSRAVRLYVPPGAMKRNGLATITRVRRGVYDLHIAAPWGAKVAVTFPARRGGGRLVAHQVAGYWVVGRLPRRSRTIWVSSLSHFSAVAKVIARLKSLPCLKKPGRLAKLGCLAEIGLIPLEVLHEVLNYFSSDDPCREQVLARIVPVPGEDHVRGEVLKDLPCLSGGSGTEPGRPVPPVHQPINPLPPLEAQPIQPISPLPLEPRRAIVVDNRVTNGMGMREDTSPARLTTQPWTFCTRRGCNIYGTERGSGQTYDAAVCQTFGERTTNGHDTDPSDDANPLRFESTRYYGVRLGDGTFGFVSEVWIRAADRGGSGLPGC